MKKIISLVAVLALALTMLTACGGNQQSAADTAGNADSTAAADNASTDQDAAAPAEETLSGTVSTNGSTSMEKVVAALIEAFTAEHPDVTITYDATGSGTGITAVGEGSTDIGLSSRNLKSEETGLTGTVIALDGIAVIVNNANPVQDLTMEQIAALATGEITNWKEVGGDDAPVTVIGREAGSGTRDGFESIVDVKDSCAYDQELTSTGAVIAAVSANEYAIGYASLSAVNDTVKAVTVEGVACTEATVLDGSYVIQRPFLMVTKDGADLSPAAQAFLEFAQSSDVADIIANAGAIQPKG